MTLDPIVSELQSSKAAKRSNGAASVPIPAEPLGGGGTDAARVRAYLRRCCQEIEATPKGCRNDTMSRTAYALGGLVHYGVPADEMVRELMAAAWRGGWDRSYPHEATCRRQLAAGAEKPCRLEDRPMPEAMGEPYANSGAQPPGVGLEAAPERTKPMTPLDVIARWQVEGPLVRLPTGIGPLDDMCRGGIPIPWRVLLVGAPSAGKTALGIIIANHMARELVEAGVCVGILAVDEEPDDLTVRLAQIAGFTVAQAELRDPEVLGEMAAALAGVRVRLYDATHTIESAAADLAAWAQAEGKRAALMIDSVQAARSDAALEADTPRLVVESNIQAMRVAMATHRMLVIATSEANRASYRHEDAAEVTNDLAAGAESRAIEFGAQTQLMLRTPKGHPNVIHVRVAKNRRADRGEFWLRLDRERHTVEPCERPEPEDTAEERDQAKAARERNKTADTAAALVWALHQQPGLTVRGLRSALKAAMGRCSRERADAAMHLLGGGVVERLGERRAVHHYLDGAAIPNEILQRLEPHQRAMVALTKPPSEEPNP